MWGELMAWIENRILEGEAKLAVYQRGGEPEDICAQVRFTTEGYRQVLWKMQRMEGKA